MAICCLANTCCFSKYPCSESSSEQGVLPTVFWALHWGARVREKKNHNRISEVLRSSVGIKTLAQESGSGKYMAEWVEKWTILSIPCQRWHWAKGHEVGGATRGWEGTMGGMYVEVTGWNKEQGGWICTQKGLGVCISGGEGASSFVLPWRIWGTDGSQGHPWEQEREAWDVGQENESFLLEAMGTSEGCRQGWARGGLGPFLPSWELRVASVLGLCRAACLPGQG